MIPTTDLYDRFGDDARVLPAIFIDYGGKLQFSGAAVTVRCFEDNSRIKELVNTPGSGRVLVVDGGASMRTALLGDIIGEEAVRNGWSGLILNACVRDKAALRKLPLGIKALGTIPRKSFKFKEGQTDLPVNIGGVLCNPGDVVVADEDGIVILTPAQASSI